MAEHTYKGFPVSGFEKPPRNSWQEVQVEEGRKFPVPVTPAARVQRDAKGSIVYGDNGEPLTNPDGHPPVEVARTESGRLALAEVQPVNGPIPVSSTIEQPVALAGQPAYNTVTKELPCH